MGDVCSLASFVPIALISRVEINFFTARLLMTIHYRSMYNHLKFEAALKRYKSELLGTVDQ